MAGKTWFSTVDFDDLLPGRNTNRQEPSQGKEHALRAWYWRLEFTLIAIPAALTTTLGIVGLAISAILMIGLTAWPTSRGLLARALHRARVRRDWMKAVRDSGAADPPPGPARRLDSYLTLARPKRIRMTTIGELMLVRTPGRGARLLEQHKDEIASSLHVREVRIARDPNDAGKANVLLVRRDPFDAAEPVHWPNINEPQLSLWDWIPLGVDEDGGPLGVNLFERNLLVGGEPGGGKSCALSLMVATAALDPSATLSVVDGKDVEFAAWEHVATRSAGTDMNAACRVLREVQEDMNERYRILKAQGLRKITPDLGLGLHLLVVDELQYFVRNPNSKASSEFLDRLLNIVARGRAAGVVSVVAAQKPDHKTVDTALRDLFGFRWAFRCNTPQASDTILGQGWSTAGVDASMIPGAQRGVGFLLAEGERPVKGRGYLLDDEDIVNVIKHGTTRSGGIDDELGGLTGNEG